MRFLLLVLLFSPLSGARAASVPATFRLDAKANVLSSVGLDLQAGSFAPDSDAVANHPTTVLNNGDQSLIDLGTLSLVSNFGNLGRIFELPDRLRVVVDLVLSVRVSACRRGMLNVHLQPNLANGFSRVALSTAPLRWKHSGGTELSSSAPLSLEFADGATTQNTQIAFDLAYTLPSNERTDTVIFDLVGGM